ncbi:hypothetical protein HHI36_008665 [Cryptolaemus montrouzieri]|uniref:Clarin-3 n=1 Tax=Cryptolaemus montrouzieri TaxID=559131 RepID=A0ABD2MT83_9CUCU
MVETKRSLVLLTCFLSGAACIISFVSLFTHAWVNSTVDASNVNNYLNYGLFSGTFNQRIATNSSADVSMTCSYSKNVCAVLCADNREARKKILDQLYNGEKTNSISCTPTKATLKSFNSFLGRRLKDTSQDKIFINAFAYLFTIIFLILSAILGLVSVGLSVWNTASNPVEVYFSIFGLYIYNGIAFCSLLISFLIWGIMFFTSLVKGPAFLYVLDGRMEPESVELGWSYWINIGSLLLYASSIGTLYLRSYLISKEPQIKIEIEDNTPAGILLF